MGKTNRILLLFLVLLVGCLPLPHERRMLGLIEYFDLGATDVLTVPATVRAGEEFDVTVSTFTGACDRAGETQLHGDGMTATITVYDFVAVRQACNANVVRASHTATLRFDQPGTATIRVHGRREDRKTPNEGTPMTIEQQIVVE